MQKLTAEWVDKAEQDFHVVTMLTRGHQRLHDQVCFHCQQCAEKYLKALLQELGVPVPRIHNLLALRTLLLPYYPLLRPTVRGLKFLSRFAVGPRYPDYSATKRQAAAALRWASRVRDACRGVLGIKPSRPRRRKLRDTP